jgi:LytR cell envelope-related transcriptional attenuator
VTGPIPPSSQVEPPDEPDGPRTRVAIGRALILVVVAVVLGVVLLNVGSRPPASVSDTGPAIAGTTTTTTHPKTAATTTTTVPKSQVKVLVANGTNLTGVAEYFTQKLQQQGWQTLTAVDTTSDVSTSNVYYAAGQQAAAAEIAESLGLKPSAVLPLTTSVPVQGTTGVDVVVVIGPDLGAQDTQATTT